MNPHQLKYMKKKKRIRLNGIFYAVLSSASFGFSPLFSLGLIAVGLTNFDILSYRWGIAGIVLMIYAFIGAVVQESFRNCPPTAAELAENPSLERYLP